MGRGFLKLTLVLLGLMPCWAWAENVLVVTDIHFNPFAKESPEAVRALAQSDDPDAWKLAFAALATYGQEMTTGSLDSGLAEIGRQATAYKVRKVFVCGDMLEHFFLPTFQKYEDQARYAQFSANVVCYVLDRLRAATNGAEIYFVPGNNDTDQGDYSTATPAFWKTVAASVFSSPQNPSYASFCELGYSCSPLNDSVNVIGLNFNLLTRAKPNPDLAAKQLALLRRDLEATAKAGKHAILLTHEPFGLDVFTSFITRKLTPFLDQDLQKQYLDVVMQYADIIPEIFSGHSHREYFELVGGRIPLIGTLALNSDYGNNPGFKVVTLDDKDGRMLDYTTYYEDLLQPKPQWAALYSFNATYNSKGLPVAEVIGGFSRDFKAPAVQSLSLYYNGKSPRVTPLSNGALWPLYYTAITHLDRESYLAFLKANFPAAIPLISGPPPASGSRPAFD